MEMFKIVLIIIFSLPDFAPFKKNQILPLADSLAFYFYLRADFFVARILEDNWSFWHCFVSWPLGYVVTKIATRWLSQCS